MVDSRMLETHTNISILIVFATRCCYDMFRVMFAVGLCVLNVFAVAGDADEFVHAPPWSFGAYRRTRQLNRLPHKLCVPPAWTSNSLYTTHTYNFAHRRWCSSWLTFGLAPTGKTAQHNPQDRKMPAGSRLPETFFFGKEDRDAQFRYGDNLHLGPSLVIVGLRDFGSVWH